MELLTTVNGVELHRVDVADEYISPAEHLPDPGWLIRNISPGWKRVTFTIGSRRNFFEMALEPNGGEFFFGYCLVRAAYGKAAAKSLRPAIAVRDGVEIEWDADPRDPE